MKLILSLSIVCATSLWFSANAYGAADKDFHDNWSKPGGDAPDKEVPGWLVNLGPTGARAIITETSFIVRYIFKGSPAVGKLNLDDEIVGVFGKPFDPKPKRTGPYGYEGPFMEFGQAIEKAEGKDGKLVLNVKRGSKNEEVTIDLEAIGTFSATFPINCKKSELLRARALKYFVDHPEADGQCNTGSAISLALLSSDDPKHQALAKKRILGWAAHRPDDGTWTWPAAYQLITLGEYYLVTKDASVLPAMKACVEHLEKIQYKVGINIPFHERTGKPLVVNGVTFDYDKLKAAIDYYDGGFGHGSPGGYGPMQYTTILAVIGWQLAERCGLTVTPARMDCAFKYIHYGTNASGALAYGSEFTFGGYAIEDPLAFGRQTGGERAVGKSGAALIAHKLASERADSTEYIEKYKKFYKTAYAGLPNGHADGNLNLFWGFVVAGAMDDEAILRTVMDYFKPWINMSRCFDGSFVAQPNRHSGDDDAYYHSSRYNPTASMALALGMGTPKLIIQGIQVSLPGVNPKALKGRMDTAYRAIVKKSYAEAAAALKNPGPEDATVAATMLAYLDVRAQQSIAMLEAVEKTGDIALLKTELTKAQTQFGLLPAFKEKVARLEEGFLQDAWKLELKRGAEYRKLLEILKRNKTDAYAGDLERFGARNPDSLYGKWAVEVAKEYRASRVIKEPSTAISLAPAPIGAGAPPVSAAPNGTPSAGPATVSKEAPAKPVSAAPKSGLTPEAMAQWNDRFIKKLDALGKAGQKLKLDLGDGQEYFVRGANEQTLILNTQGNDLPMPWRMLSASCRAALAKDAATDDDVEALLIAAVLNQAIGKADLAETLFAKAGLKDAAATKLARAELGTPR